MEVYFAYGSNINMKQMKQRCPSVHFLSKAILQGHLLVFPIYSEDWKGGVAGVIPESTEQVEGVAYEISKKDIKKLDEFEKVDKKRYYRRKANVILPDRANIEAWVYFANPEKGWPFQPSRKYLETILEGAIEHQLSERLINYLKLLLTKSNL